MRPLLDHCAPVLAGFAVLFSVLGGCAGRPADSARRDVALPSLSRRDIEWLARVNFGLDSASVQEFRRLGRER